MMCKFVFVLVMFLSPTSPSEFDNSRDTKTSDQQQANDANDAKAQLAEVNQRLNVVTKKLNQRSRELQGSAEVAAERKKSDKAWTAYRNAGNSDPQIIAQRAAHQTSGEQLELIVEKQLESTVKTRELRQSIELLMTKEVDQAFAIAVMSFKLNHQLAPWHRELNIDPELMKLKRAAAASKSKADTEAYLKSRDAKLNKLPAAKLLIDEIAKLQSQLTDDEKTLTAKQTELSKARTVIKTGKDPEIVKAREAVSKARLSYNAAWKSENMKTLYQAYSTAFKTYQSKVETHMKSDAQVVTLREERKELTERASKLKKTK